MGEPLGERKADLESERHRINDEIKNYPTPIPACDAQFNFLLEERARIARELRELEAAEPGNRPVE
jgi:hypothetical protein